MNYTSIKQSKKLLELGLNPYTSDMYWDYNDHYTTTPKEKDYSIIASSLNPSCGWDNIDPYLIPCWSLGALLELMPKQLYINNNAWEVYSPVIYLGEQSVIAYQHSNIFAHSEYSKNTIEAAYNMVVWLLENGYIKTEKK